MKMRDLFIGRPLYWALLVAVAVILGLLGLDSEHVRHFVIFIFLVLGLSALLVAAVMLTYRPGERITREPLEDGPKKSK